MAKQFRKILHEMNEQNKGGRRIYERLKKSTIEKKIEENYKINKGQTKQENRIDL